jgi:hypothetical protein
VTAVLTAGHTPGHQSFVVDLDPAAGEGGFVFAFDAADLTANIDEELGVGGFIDCAPGGHGGRHPPPQSPRRRARLPRCPRPRPRRLAGAHRGAGRPVAVTAGPVTATTPSARRAEALATRLLERAVERRGWRERMQGRRIARLLDDPDGLAFVLALTDEVLRIRDRRRAARHLRSLVAPAPAFLGPLDRRLLGVGAGLAERLPHLVMPLVGALRQGAGWDTAITMGPLIRPPEEAGNLYVNRHITGAVVRRQPFGGWKRSVVVPGAKAGGRPHYVASLGIWTATFDGGAAAFADAVRDAWAGDLRPPNPPAWPPKPTCCATVPRPEVGAHDAGLWVDDLAVVAAPRIEALRWAREQALSETRHRHGDLTGRHKGPFDP